MTIISPTGKGCVEVFERPILEGKGESERGREREREIRAKHHLRRIKGGMEPLSPF